MKTIGVWNKKKLNYESILIDDEDFQRVSKYKWYLNKKGQVMCSPKSQELNGGNSHLARFILNLDPNDPIVDHKDRNKLNNQKENLRICDLFENQGNRIQNSSNEKFKGVHQIQASGRWRACITKNNDFVHLGCFNTAEEAAKAYDLAAIRYFGEFALLNFPIEKK